MMMIIIKIKHNKLCVTGVYLRDITNTSFFFPGFALECESSGCLFFSLNIKQVIENLRDAACRFPVLAVANKGSSVGPQNKIRHLAHRHRRLMQVAVLGDRGL